MSDYYSWKAPDAGCGRGRRVRGPVRDRMEGREMEKRAAALLLCLFGGMTLLLGIIKHPWSHPNDAGRSCQAGHPLLACAPPAWRPRWLPCGMVLSAAGIWTGTEHPRICKEEESISIDSVIRRRQRDSPAVYFPERRVKITGFKQTHQR